MPHTQDAVQSGRLLTLCQAWLRHTEEKVPGARDWVVDQKPGHCCRLTPQGLPWFIPISPSTHQLWMEVGGREE